MVEGVQPDSLALSHCIVELPAQRAAVRHCAAGAGLWALASNDAADDKQEPNVVMACAGDVPTLEALAAMRQKKLETGQGSLHRSTYERNRLVAQVERA